MCKYQGENRKEFLLFDKCNLYSPSKCIKVEENVFEKTAVYTYHISEVQIWLPLPCLSLTLLGMWLVNPIDSTHPIGSCSLNASGSGSGSQIWTSLFLIGTSNQDTVFLNLSPFCVLFFIRIMVTSRSHKSKEVK